MPSLDRDDIHIISRNSNWPAGSVDKALREQVYNDKPAWQKFLKLLFISLGIGFTTAGVIFFFAYNWASLHKFVKIGLIEGLIVITTLTILSARISIPVKNAMLTGASALAGVLFAVFGQVYQTGANAYDLFLSWTLSITLWVAIANFAPLWLLYIILLNTTLILYEEQVAKDWPEILIPTLLFLINSAFLAGSLFISKYRPATKAPAWFLIVLALGAVTLATLGMITGIFDERSPAFIVLILAVILLYAAGILYGIRQKNLFYLAIIPFSVIVIISALFIKLSHDAGMFLFTFLFVTASVTLLTKKLIDKQKQWAYEERA